MRNVSVLILILAVLLISVAVFAGCTTQNSNDDSSDVLNADNSENDSIETENNTSDIKINVRSVNVSAKMSSYKIFFIADSHISMCDERDSELMEKASTRSNSFMHEGVAPQDTFDRLIDEAIKSDCNLVIFGGDIIDSAMYASIEHVSEQLKRLNKPYIYFMGNHDFEYGSEYFSPKAYEEYLPRLNEIHGEKSYQIKEEEEVIVFAADDSNSQIDVETLEAFKEVQAKGKPIVLAVHVPLEPQEENSAFVEKCKEVWGPSPEGKSRVTMGYNGVYPNETTREFLNLVFAEDSNVELVLGGHVHFYSYDVLNNNITQVVTGAAFDGEAVSVELKWPEW